MDEKNETEFKFRWSLVVLLAVFFVSIIIYHFSNTLTTIKANTGKAVVRYSNTPAATEANEIDSLHLEQKQDISMPVVTEVAPRIEAICISGSGKSSIYVREDFAHEGDIVDGFRILKIYPNKVEFEKNGKKVTAVFPPPEDRQGQSPKTSLENNSVTGTQVNKN